MKKLLIGFLVLIFTLSFTMVTSAGQRDKDRKQQPQQRERQYKNDDRRQHPRYYGQGYRYHHHDRRNYRPNHYRGHWRSWREWNDHRRHNHNWYRNGKYYRENNKLYFEFENEDGRFVFSIGR